MRLHAALLLALLFVSLALMTAPLSAQEAETIEVYADGSIKVELTLAAPETAVQLAVKPVMPPAQVLAYDANGLPLEATFNGTHIIIYTLGATTVKLIYYCENASKLVEGVWRLELTTDRVCRIVLPPNATLVEVQPVPKDLAEVDGKLVLVFDPGKIGVGYTMIGAYAPPPPTKPEKPQPQQPQQPQQQPQPQQPSQKPQQPPTQPEKPKPTPPAGPRLGLLILAVCIIIAVAIVLLALRR